TRDGLHALDPVSGDTLWTRGDVRPRGWVFGDNQYVYLAELPEGGPPTTRVFRASDGVTVNGIPDFGAAFQDRQVLDGSHIFACTTRDTNVLLRLYDIPTGKDLWKKECPTGSLVVHCEAPHQGAVLEPNGALTVLDLQSGREVLKAQVDAEAVGRVQG